MSESIHIHAKTINICMIIHELVNRGLIKEATRTLKTAGFIHKSELLDKDKLQEMGSIMNKEEFINELCSNPPIKEIK